MKSPGFVRPPHLDNPLAGHTLDTMGAGYNARLERALQTQEVRLGPLSGPELELVSVISRINSGERDPELLETQDILVGALDGELDMVAALHTRRDHLKSRGGIGKGRSGTGKTEAATVAALDKFYDKELERVAQGHLPHNANILPRGTILNNIFKDATPATVEALRLLQDNDNRTHGPGWGGALRRKLDALNQTTVPETWTVSGGTLVSSGEIGLGDFLAENFRKADIVTPAIHGNRYHRRAFSALRAQCPPYIGRTLLDRVFRVKAP